MAQVPSFDYYTEEDTNGIRFNWNIFPTTRTEETKLITPIGAVYSPLAQISSEQYFVKLPTRCKNCHGVINPFCIVDQAAGVWNCSLCLVRNPITDLQGMDWSNLEYVIPKQYNKVVRPLVFMFVIDLNLDPEELASLKETIEETLEYMPDCSIGLISFDANVYLHELQAPIIKKIGFNGKKDYSGPIDKFEFNKTLTHITHKETFLRHLGSLKPLPECKDRHARSTGVALSIASKLLKSYNLDKGHIFTFVGGPCTVGPGSIVGISKSEPIRTFHDISNGKVSKLKPSLEFYDSLVDDRYSCNLFIASYDQIGIFEMRNLTSKTGGWLLMNDSFTTNLFKQSYRKIFEVDETTGVINFHSNAELKVLCSSHIAVSGFISNGIPQKPLAKEHSSVSDVVIGDGLTNAIKLPAISNRHTVTTFFTPQTVGHTSEKPSIPMKSFIQFQTKYQHNDGTERIRITTVTRSTMNETNGRHIEFFDQETNVVLMTKLALHKHKFNEKAISLEINQRLESFMQTFATFLKGEQGTFQMLPQFQFLPKFIYDLLKSPVLSLFNITPDEKSYYLDVFSKVSVNDCLLMIQPQLLQFGLNQQEPEPVELETRVIQHDKIYLMDSYFQVLIQYGETIANWRDTLDLSEYPHVAELMELVRTEAMDILSDRFPLPRYIMTDEGKSQSRFLRSRLNNESDEHSFQRFYVEKIAKVVGK